MSKRPGRHRVRDFARAVDGAGHPSSAVSRLAAIANALRSTPRRSVSAPGGNVRRRLVAAASTGLPAEPRRSLTDLLPRVRLGGLSSAAVLCTALIAVVGLGLGTTQSLPGDTLYRVKLSGEEMRLALISSDEERGRKTLHFADTRLNEIRKLVRQHGNWPTSSAGTGRSGERERDAAKLINRTLQTMDRSTSSGAAAIRDAYQETGRSALLSYLSRFTNDQQEILQDLLPRLPDASRSSALDSLSLVSTVNRQALELLDRSCTTNGLCTDDGKTTMTSHTTTSDPSDTSPASDENETTTASGDPGQTTSTPPQSSSRDTGTGTSSGGSGTGSSSTGESQTSGTGDESSSGDSGETPETPTTTPSDTSEPPQPTGVPSDPSGSGSNTSKSVDADGRTSDTRSAGSGEDEPESGQRQDASEPGTSTSGQDSQGSGS